MNSTTIRHNLLSVPRVARLDHLTFRLFAGLLLDADANGIVLGNHAYLKGRLLWAHEPQDATLVHCLRRLEKRHLIERYRAGHEDYIAILDLADFREQGREEVLHPSHQGLAEQGPSEEVTHDLTHVPNPETTLDAVPSSAPQFEAYDRQVQATIARWEQGGAGNA